MKNVLFAFVISLSLAGAAFAHHYICEFCGAGVSASNMPRLGNSCLKNPVGKFHQWIQND